MSEDAGVESHPELLVRAGSRGAVPALRDPSGEATYEGLVAMAEAGGQVLSGDPALAEPRVRGATPVVALLVPPGVGFVVAQWSAWSAGAMVVPLGFTHPPGELEFALRDSGAHLVVVTPDTVGRIAVAAASAGVPLVTTGALAAPGRPGGDESATARAVASGPADARTAALMLYTSGTTGRPKGVVHTHATLSAQMRSLTEAWAWSSSDHILLTLPLHHIHGLVNALGCALWNGGRCSILPGFDAVAVWERFAEGGLTLFMGVPTQYALLLHAFDEAREGDRRRWAEGASRLRLMVSGSAALPVGILERWEEVTGHRLLERYGMTEIGMALSNPLEGERRAGHVGQALPGVEVRLVDEDGDPVADGEEGEIQVRGPTLFREYWQHPDATFEAFDGDWFRTGDIAQLNDGAYRILGRRSVDILKTGGYKVSALEIEEVLREHPRIREVAVVGLEDEVWGERVAAALVADAAGSGPPLTLDAIREWAGARLAPYKLPTLIRVVEDLPRNAMGKVQKPEVRRLVERAGRDSGVDQDPLPDS